MGEVYVSDTLATKIHVLKNGKLSLFDSGDKIEYPNGLLVVGNELLVGGWGKTTDFSTKVPGRLFGLDLKTKKKRLVTQKPFANIDGLELDENGNYLITDWAAGKVFRVTRQGKATLLLEGFQGPADLAYIPETQILILPKMKENKVTAYNIGTALGG